MSALGYYTSHSATVPAEHISLAELAQLAQTPTVAANGVHPAQADKPTRARLKAQAALITPFDGNGKTSSAAQRASYSVVVQDHDDDNKSESDIRQIYAALKVPYLAFTTSSHTDDAPRWKVLIPLAVPCDAEQHGKISRGLAQSLGTDTAQARTQQGFYAPHKLIDDAPYSVINELDSHTPVDIKDNAHPFVIEAMAGWAELEEAEEEGAAVQAQVKKLQPSNAEGAGIIGKISEYFSHDLRSVMQQRQYKGNVGKMLRPRSSSGAPAVHLFDEGTPEVRCYSHHGADDPLSASNHNGHALDLPAVICALDFNNDMAAMVKHYAPLVDADGQKQRQREYAQEQERLKTEELFLYDQDGIQLFTHHEDGTVSPAMRSTEPCAPLEPRQHPFDDNPPYNLFGTFALPALPMDLIPQAIADYSADQGELIGADPAAMVLFCLAVAGACIDDRIKIQVKRHDPTWRESARLWCGVIGDPSVKKSPLLNKALAPAFAIDSEWRQETNKAMAEWRKACENPPKGEDEPPMPIGKRLLLNDATVEKVGDILSKCEPKGMLSYQDELSGWLASMDAYKGGTGGKDKGSWLEAFNGGPKFFDRISRGELYVENWSVSVVGGIQPSVIQSYAQATNHDGMLQRFILLYAQQPKELGQDRAPKTFAKLNYSELIKHLAMLEPSANPVKLSEPAHKHREALERKVHALVCNHPNPHLTAALGKWSGLYARLLLVWHCCDSHDKQKYPTGYEVTGETAEKVAVFMWRVLLPHLLKFYGAIDPFEDSSQDLARLILAKGWQRFTVKRDFNQQWKASRKMKPWEIEQVLERLEGFNWITPDPQAIRNINGTPAAYIVNPEVHALHAEQAQAERDRRQEIAAALAELQASHA